MGDRRQALTAAPEGAVTIVTDEALPLDRMAKAHDRVDTGTRDRILLANPRAKSVQQRCPLHGREHTGRIATCRRIARTARLSLDRFHAQDPAERAIASSRHSDRPDAAVHAPRRAIEFAHHQARVGAMQK